MSSTCLQSPPSLDPVHQALRTMFPPVTELCKALVLEEEMDDTLQYELIPVNNMTEGRIIYY